MPLETFAPGQNPNLGLSFDQEPKVFAARFGDGYVQRTPNGLNADPIVFPDLEWGPIALDRAEYIIDFLRRHKGSIPFWWTHPRETVPRKFTCPRWSATEVQWNARSIRATFEEDFGLDT